MDAAQEDKRKWNGRKKGSKNKTPADLIDAVMHSFNSVGGKRYLAQQAIENPACYLALLAKVLPKNIQIRSESTSLHVHHDTRDWLANQILTLTQQQARQEIEVLAIPELEPAQESNVIELAPPVLPPV